MRLSRTTLLAASVLAWALAAVGAQGAVQFTSLLSFNGTNGANPKGEVIQGSDGRLYGTTVEGGSNGFGTVYALSLDGSGFTTLYSFLGGSDGANPSAGLVQGKDMGFYGTALNGGANSTGAVFRVTAEGGFITIASLSTNTGADPDTTLVLANDGSLYGTADMEGENSNRTYPGTSTSPASFGYGSIIRVTTEGNLTAPLLFANTNGDSPRGGLIQASDGDFYGTTQWGGRILSGTPYNIGFGTIYRFSTNGSFTTLYEFTGGVDGGWPYAGLVQARDGNFYGAAFSGGSLFFGYGSIFRITPNGEFTKIHTFVSSDGANPYASLIQASDGNLYGTTYVGGSTNSAGSIFQITTNGVFTSLYAFSVDDGLFPLSRLLQANDGNFYGTTAKGGAYGLGTIFRLSVPLPPVILEIAWTNGTVACTWTAVASQTYQLEYTANLAAPKWTPLGQPVIATTGTLSAVDPSPSDQPRWYRVALLP